MGLVSFISSLGACAVRSCATDMKVELKATESLFLYIERVYGLACFCWFIAGNVWVFGNWSSVNFDHHMTNHTLTNLATNGHNEDYYCDKTAYMFSFVLLMLGWVAGPILLLACCCCWSAGAATMGLGNGVRYGTMSVV